MTMDTEHLLSILPHRAPFLLIDSVIAGEEDCWIRATWNIPMQHPMLSGRGTLPAVLLIEAIAQTAAALLLSSRPCELPMLLGIERAVFCGEARAGDLLVLDAEIVRLRRHIGRARGRATNSDGIVLCKVDFTFGRRPIEEGRECNERTLPSLDREVSSGSSPY